MPPNTPPPALSPRSHFISPDVVRAHRLLRAQTGPSARPAAGTYTAALVRKFRNPRYVGRSPRRPAREFARQLARLAQEYPLCRFCLLTPGNICEHSHPHEASPRRGEIPVRALSACAKCNAAEREALRRVCREHGAHLRRTHVSRWPERARASQVADLAARINPRRAAAGRSPLRAARLRRILKFPPPPTA